jgi:DNA-binding NtrC family response regulator
MRGDIPLLINHFFALYNDRLSKQIEGIDRSALDILCGYGFPGNVRELQYLVESAMILCKGDMITPDLLPKEVQTEAFAAEASDAKIDLMVGHIPTPRSKKELRAARDEAQKMVERLFLEEMLSITGGNVAEAARRVRMNRSWLS